MRQTRTRGRKWVNIRAKVLRDNPLCVSCLSHGRVNLSTQVDHITPLHKGGTDALDNLQGLCHECHADKSAKDLGYRRCTSVGLDGWPEGSK